MPSFLNAMTRQIPSSSIHAATQKAEAYRREGKKVVIFSIGRPDFDTPAHIKEAAKAALDKGYVHYTPNMGILPLREAVAEHIKRQTGVSYDPKTEVMITCGVPHLVKQALGSAKPLHVLPGCALGGAAFCLLCDLIARSLFAPTELSISSVTAVFGAPVVIWLLVRRQSGEGRA